MAEQVFQRARLRLARELVGLSQTQLADQAEVTSAALSQFESGAARPSPPTLERLAAAVDIPVGFFLQPVVETHDGFFRSLRRTSVGDRRRARALAHLVHDIVTHPLATRLLPAVNLPSHPAPDLEESPAWAESFAAQVRADWGVPAGPIPNMVDLLERHGIPVMRLPLGTADVDAFSLPFPDRPIAVLGTEKDDRGRSRFDAAHELGHLVMHGRTMWGIPAIEKQAHAFASAFLLPADQILLELPARVDWMRLIELKYRWQVSLAALLMRAKKLGRITDGAYLTAIKFAAARGWRRTEPAPLGPPETPTMIAQLFTGPYAVEITAELPRRTLSEIVAATGSGQVIV